MLPLTPHSVELKQNDDRPQLTQNPGENRIRTPYSPIVWLCWSALLTGACENRPRTPKNNEASLTVERLQGVNHAELKVTLAEKYEVLHSLMIHPLEGS